MVLNSHYSLYKYLPDNYSAMCTRPWGMVVIIDMLQRTCCPEELRAIWNLLRNAPRRAAVWPALPIYAAPAQCGESHAQLSDSEMMDGWCGAAPWLMGRKDRHCGGQNKNWFRCIEQFLTHLSPLPLHNDFQFITNSCSTGPLAKGAFWYLTVTTLVQDLIASWPGSCRIILVSPAALFSTKSCFSKHLFHHVYFC